MSVSSRPPVRTTTITAKVSDNYSRLKTQFELVSYQVPESFNYSDEHFAKLHIELKTQLNYPYYFLSPLRVIYVLYGLGDIAHEVYLGFLDDKPLSPDTIKFGDIELHILIKLLFADYFRTPNQATFVSQGDYYIYAKPETHYRTGELLWDVCLQIQANGDRRNKYKPTSEWQIFQISNSATRFRVIEKSRIKDWEKNVKAYFQKTQPSDGMVFFNQLSKDLIDEFEDDIYYIDRDKDNRAQLDYHNHRNPEYCRGKILFDFINKFIPYLQTCGLEATQQHRQMKEFRPNNKFGELELSHLKKVHVLDQRIGKVNSTEDYIELLSAEYEDLTFEPIESIIPSSTTPVLMLMDGTKEDFEKGGVLDNHDDPYRQIYNDKRYVNTPKQGVNVNIADDTNDPSEYLDYPLPSFSKKDDTGFKYRFDVSLIELLQKDMVINPRSIAGILPGFPQIGPSIYNDFVFIRKMTYTNIGNYWVLMYLENGQINFVDLRSSSARQKLYELAEKKGLDWDDVYRILCDKRFKSPDDKKPLRQFDVILGPDLAIEIEDISETVIYEYDKIIARKSSRQEPLPIDHFRLGDRYDNARTDTMLTLSQLKSLGLLNGVEPKTLKEKVSFNLYQQLRAYDEFLDDIEMSSVEISFDELTNDTNMERIADIFSLKRGDKTGKYSRRGLWEIYKRLEMFPGDKEKDVHLYQGIWYDDEHRFMVGAPEGLKEKQARAHRIRQFDVLAGTDLDIETLLQTLSVTFVRHKQYTVVPYFFHLIDIYVENILKWQVD